MSRRDARKALSLRLPEALRKELVKTTRDAHLPLAYLVRQVLRQALDGGLGWDDEVSPGTARPILLQLSVEDQARLEMRTGGKPVSTEVAVLSLVWHHLQAASGRGT